MTTTISKWLSAQAYRTSRFIQPDRHRRPVRQFTPWADKLALENRISLSAAGAASLFTSTVAATGGHGGSAAGAASLFTSTAAATGGNRGGGGAAAAASPFNSAVGAA